MSTVLRAGPNQTIVHIGVESVSEYKVEVHISRKIAEELAIEGEEFYMDEAIHTYGDEDSFEIHLGKAVLARLTQPI